MGRLTLTVIKGEGRKISRIDNQQGSLRIVGGQGMKSIGIWSKVGGQKMKFSIVLAKLQIHI